MKCTRCGHEISDDGLTTIQPIECPACGKPFPQPRQPWETGTSIIRDYFSDLWKIIAHPALFFRNMPITGGIGQPLAFALVTHWIGTALGFLWNLLMGGAVKSFLQGFLRGGRSIDYPGRAAQMMEIGDRILQWFSGVGPVLADPFLTLLSILFTSFFIFVGARILVPRRVEDQPIEITYESTVRVVCFGLSPSIFAAVPLLGGFIASLGILIVTIIGLKETYRIGTGRAIVVALFPKLLFLGMIGVGLMWVAVAIFKLFTSAF